MSVPKDNALSSLNIGQKSTFEPFHFQAFIVRNIFNTIQ